MSEVMRATNHILSELDGVLMGRVARVALLEIAKSMSHENVAACAAKLVDSMIDNWDPVGPKITDGVVKRVARNHAKQAVYDSVRKLLSELEAQ